MDYKKIRRRCNYALQDAFARNDDVCVTAVRGILDVIDEAPLKPGNIVDSRSYAATCSKKFGPRAKVLSCWRSEDDQMWLAAIEGAGGLVEVANANWFPHQLQPQGPGHVAS